MSAQPLFVDSPSPDAVAQADEADSVDLKSVIQQAHSLVSPPVIGAKLMELTRSNTATAEDFAELVSVDPNLVGRLLRITNSAYYGLRSEVDSITRAVTILGLRDLSNLVLAITAVRSMQKVQPKFVSQKKFWQHAVYVGLLSRRIAKQCDFAFADRAFVAGLLHDVGLPILYGSRPDLAGVMAPFLTADDEELAREENLHFGFSHAEVGGELLREWELPAPIYLAVLSHHRPVEQTPPEAYVVMLANYLSGHSEDGGLAAPSDPSGEPRPDWYQALPAHGIDPAILDLEALTASVDAEFGDVFNALMS